MKQCKRVALLAGLAAAAQFNIAAAAVSLSFAPEYKACVSNCAAISQAGNTLVVTLLDKAGKPFKVSTTAIDPAATKAVVSASQDSPAANGLFGAPAANGEFTVSTFNTTVETNTDTVLYTMISYYKQGQLFDGKMSEKRFSKQVAK
ncbi:MAG TPA: hypothetical protein VFS95_09735 [Telluria sp.]|nr:hypothetical protein [Telluria sp.]